MQPQTDADIKNSEAKFYYTLIKVFEIKKATPFFPIFKLNLANVRSAIHRFYILLIKANGKFLN